MLEAGNINIKRVFDCLLSIILLFVLTPLIISIAISILLSMGSPVIFKQDRPGKGQNIFQIFKFRTMQTKKGIYKISDHDKDRITTFGKILRASSLDELPELWNVIKGDMSVVGPRPLLTAYLPYYEDDERKRFLVRPGITGLAQIKGRNNVNWKERFAADIEYVNNQSIINDIKIVALTVANIITAKDVVVLPSGKMRNLDEERRNRADEQEMF